MPTGYTAGVQDGTITTLEQFALKCSRAFGVCINLRDAPNDAQIPERFEPSSYHSDQIRILEARLEHIAGMRHVEADAAAEREYVENIKRLKERQEERRVHAMRYTRMVQLVEQWEGEPEGIKEFMLEQLRESFNYDCCDRSDALPTRISGKQWREEQLADLHRGIAYHTKEHAAEIERVESRNVWLRQLRASLDASANEMSRP